MSNIANAYPWVVLIALGIAICVVVAVIAERRD